MSRLIVAALLFFAAAVCAQDLSRIKLLPGFTISYYARGISEARQIVMSKANSSIIYVGSRRAGRLYAVANKKVFTLKTGLRMPNGVEWKNNSLYVAESHRVTRYDNIDQTFDKTITGKIILDNLPTANNDWHAWKFIKFGPDNLLYIPFGAPCNYCLKKDGPGDPATELSKPYASISRANADGTGFEVYVEGIRNTVGFDWHPTTGALWFTENGRDYWGANRPDDEINVVSRKGEHFGFPFCYGKGDNQTSGGNDPIYYSGKCDASSPYTPAAAEVGPHVAAVGMRFYTGKQFPAKYQNQIIFAKHGSWNRPTGQATGYTVNIAYLSADGRHITGTETLAEGWLNPDKQNKWGRPVDIEVLPDGSILVSDDQNNCLYQISYTG